MILQSGEGNQEEIFQSMIQLMQVYRVVSFQCHTMIARVESFPVHEKEVYMLWFGEGQDVISALDR